MGGIMARYRGLLGIFLLASACAGRPGLAPYGPMSDRGGYQEEEIEPGVWRISARSNGNAGADYAWNMAEYRAGELLKAQGFSHIQMLDRMGRWELSDERAGGRRRLLSDAMEVTVRGAHDQSQPTDCRAHKRDSCWTLGIEAMMAGIRPRLKFAKSGS